MLEVRKFRVSDYFEIDRRSFDMLTFLNFPNPSAIAKALADGMAYTIVNSKHLVASGGVVPSWKGVGEAWLVSSPLVQEHKIFFLRTVQAELNKMIEEGNFERVQTTVDAEHLVSIKWVKWMGFENEGLMRKFIGGRDFWRYARVRN